MLNSAVGIPIRWRIFSLLFGFGFLAYIQQKTITVAAERIMPELGITQFEIGWIETAFVLGYALFQIPGGVMGQRLGARRTFVLIGLAAFAATLATPLLPYTFHGAVALFAAFLAAQGLLGLSQAPIFPLSAGVFEAWFPPRRWTLVQGFQTMGLNLGAALTPPLIQNLTAALGWQRALVWASLPALALIALWAWYGRNSPREHRAVTPQELAEIGKQPAAHSSIKLAQLLALVRNRDVLLLFISYMTMNYTFYLISNWVFLYLVQERHFSALQSGWLATVPPLGAAIGAGLGGVLTGLFVPRLGTLWGFRVVPLAALISAALLLLAAVNASNPFAALAALAFCFLAVELTEGAFWGAGMTVGRGDTMAVCGFMNTGGNLGGIICLPTVGYLSGHHQWRAAFMIGIALAVASASCWLAIRVKAVEDAEPEEGTPAGDEAPARELGPPACGQA